MKFLVSFLLTWLMASILLSCGKGEVSENDLYFSDLLRVRMIDQAESSGQQRYNILDADTLILPLQEYVEKNPDCGFYAEALFYAGRLYSEIGDSYRGLTRFRKALKALDTDSANNSLRRKILTNAAGLLHSLGRPEKAEEYYLEALKLDSILSDPLAMMEDRRNLGIIYLKDNAPLLAKREFDIAREIAGQISPADTAAIDIYLAEIDYHTHNWKESLRKIRSAVKNVSEPYLNLALAEAALLYNHYQYHDTAAMYANQLAWREETTNLKIGTALLLNPDISQHAAADTANKNFNRYRDWIGDNFKSIGSGMRGKKLIQTSLYNYTVHDRLRKEAEKRMVVYGYIAFGAVIVALLFILFFLITKSRKKQALLNLHEAIDRINSLNSRIDELSLPEETDGCKDKPTDTFEPSADEEGILLSQEPEPQLDNKEKERILIEKLKDDLLSRFSDVVPGEIDYVIPKSLVNSDAYKALRRQIKSEKPLPPDSKIWKQIDKAVCKNFPDFKRNFSYLTGKGMTDRDLHTALLIKCGLTPSEMALILSIEVSSVGSRRSSISKRIYGRNVGSSTIDAIIQSL